MYMMERVVIAFLTLISGTSGFNIATKSVQVIPGQANSLFGYSLDFIKHDSQGNIQKWLLIGAPRFRGSDGNITGGVFKRQATVNGQSAALLDILKDVSDTGKDIPTGDKREMWLGASMATSDNTATVCAPRWKNAFNNSELYMNGLCYVFPSGFLDPVSSKFLDVTPRRLLVSYPDKQHISPDPSRYDMEWEYGLGAAGMSVIYDKSNQDKDYTLYGAPGVNEFTGAVLFQGDSSQAAVHGQDLMESKESKMYGISMAMGKFYGDGVFYTAMGGPRAMGTGQVLILNRNFSIKEKITGSEPGSYFGASLCAVKRMTNSEEYLLLVGAPHYSSMTMYDKFYTSVVEKGAVFVYRLTIPGTEPIQMLSSSSEPRSRFGSAMADLGDINKDGFSDVVIGAPFEELDKGVIYVYNGFEKGFMETQRIVGMDLDTALNRQFGGAFSQKNMDVSGDNSVDVAVGSYGASMAAILYTRPSISMEVSAKNTTKLTAPGAPDFFVLACFKFGGGPEISSDVLVDYRIRADTRFSGERKRVCIVNEQGSCQDEVVEMGQAIQKNLFDPKCLRNFTAKVLEMKEAREIFTPIVFSIQYNISDSNTCTKAVCPLINRFYGDRKDPMATEVEALTVNFMKPGCGSDNICQTDVSLQVSKPSYFINPGGSVLVLGPKSGFTIDITLTVSGEPAYNTKLKITCREPLSYVQTVRLHGIEMKCSVINSDSGISDVECDTNPSQLGLRNETIKIRLEFDARNLRPEGKSFDFMVEATTLSEDTNKANSMKKLIITKEAIVEKDFETSVKPEIYVTKEDAATRDFETMTHGITFFNRGPSNIDGEATFTIKFPAGRIGKKWILNATDAMMNISNALPETTVDCDVKVTDAGSFTGRVRAYKAVALATMNITKDEDMDAQYDCRRPGSCNTITCKVQPIQANSYVQVKLNFMFDPQLYGRAAGQNPDVESVDLVSVLNVELPKNIRQKLLQNNNFAKTEILPTKQKAKSIPPYVIVLAVIGALLLLAGVVFGLFKCGFFKRQAKEQLEKMKEEGKPAGQQEEPPEIHVTDADEKQPLSTKDYSANGKADDQQISMPDAPDTQGEPEDWGEVDALLGDLGPASPDDVKIETTADVINENKKEPEYAQMGKLPPS